MSDPPKSANLQIYPLIPNNSTWVRSLVASDMCIVYGPPAFDMHVNIYIYIYV